MLDTGSLPCYTFYMVMFTSEPLELNIGDIVVEANTNLKWDGPPVTFYWVIYSISKDRGYYAFSLQDENEKIGPIVFRSNEFWEYKVIHYD